MEEHLPDTTPLRVAVIIGSTREGRFGDTVARWIIERAQRRDDLKVDVIDLAERTLPITMPRDRPPEIRRFTEQLGDADAFIVVTPEYNHSFPGPLKNAIDLARAEWAAKPVAFVAYGGLSGGLRAVEQLRLVFAELHATTIRDTISFHMAHGQFDDHGQPKDESGTDAAATTLLDRLVWWGLALRDARARHPYG